MMGKKKVLDVGQCDPDHGAISSMLHSHFEVEIDRVMFVDEAMEALGRTAYDLVLFNRLTFADGSDGLELVRRMRSDASLREVPVMMVSNYEDAQARAVEAGGVRGFGKGALSEPETIATLSAVLGDERG